MVHPIVSVGWRFLLASITVLGICRFWRASRLDLSEHALCDAKNVSILLELWIVLYG